MSRPKRAPGERPIYWVVDDLLAFPEAVKDKIGVALSVPSSKASIQPLHLGKAPEAVYLRLRKIIGATRIERFTR